MYRGMGGSTPAAHARTPARQVNRTMNSSATNSPATRNKTLTTELRFGWTTGTCATAGVHAAYTAMATGEFPEYVVITTPSKKQAKLAITETSTGQDDRGQWFSAAVVKDAGDDPDVTHGAVIGVVMRQAKKGEGVGFTRGEGVGLVTKPGLPVAVGEPAINPVPRRMMEEAVAELAVAHGGPRDVEIEVFVRDGEAIATKTWNPRLGIEGGISILGTTGVVRPFSCSAWIASIHRGVDVSRACNLTHVIASTGATSEAWGRAHYKVPDIALIDMGDFVGGMLKYMRRNPVANLTITGGFGKLTKLGQGAIDLHSARSQVDFAKLSTIAGECGLDPSRVAGANSVLDVSQMATDTQRTRLATRVAEAARATVLDVLRGAAINVEIAVIDREGNLLGRAGDVES